MVKLARTYQGMPKPFGKIGWFRESIRHSLAAQGIKTSYHPLLAVTPIERAYQTIGKSDPMTQYDFELDKINLKFEELWKMPKGKEQDDAFDKVRETEYYPLIRKILAHREPRPMPVIEYDTPIVVDASRGDNGHIQWMTPDRFLELTMNPEDMPEPDKIMRIYEGIKSGKKYNVGFLEIERNKITGHEGRHRAYTAKIFGWETIPVAIVGYGHETFNPRTAKHEWEMPKHLNTAQCKGDTR